MSITAVNSTQNTYQPSQPVNFKQVRTDYQNLAAAVQSGDMTAAQEAFAALQKDDPQVAKALAQSSQTSTNPQVAALQSLSKALQSGDPTAAQSALTSLQQSLKGHRGHHHSDSAAAAQPPAPDAGVTGATDGDGDDDGSGGTRATLLNAIA